MPTGYTSPVADGKVTTLREYALSCARGMGALIMMRDEPWDAPIPERFEPGTKFYDEGIASARAILAELPTLSLEECERRAAAERAAKAAADASYRADKQANRQRYEGMIALVAPWEGAPDGLKEFMLSQLRESIDFDCREYPRDEPPVETGAEWRERTAKKAAKDLGYHEQHRAEEIHRTEQRNAWIAQLRAALDGAQP
jgi:hypothetical protein